MRRRCARQIHCQQKAKLAKQKQKTTWHAAHHKNRQVHCFSKTETAPLQRVIKTTCIVCQTCTVDAAATVICDLNCKANQTKDKYNNNNHFVYDLVKLSAPQNLRLIECYRLSSAALVMCAQPRLICRSEFLQLFIWFLYMCCGDVCVVCVCVWETAICGHLFSCRTSKAPHDGMEWNYLLVTSYKHVRRVRNEITKLCAGMRVKQVRSGCDCLFFFCFTHIGSPARWIQYKNPLHFTIRPKIFQNRTKQ